MALELKYCELCGRPFTREAPEDAKSGQRDCELCVAANVELDTPRPTTVALDLLLLYISRGDEETAPSNIERVVPTFPTRHRKPVIDPWRDPWPGAPYKPDRFKEE